MHRKTEGVKSFSSVYLGGGTPTVLPDDLLEELLLAIISTTGADIREITVEAGRPDTITHTNLSVLKKYGVHRVSINPQTLNQSTLGVIGRDHTVYDFFEAFTMAREAGIPIINVDLIAGLPGESAIDMENAMDIMERLSPENITVHTLALKRASGLIEKKDSYTIPSPQVVWEMLEIARTSCAHMNLNPYYLYRQKNMAGHFENIGYSKSGTECLYNVGMMGELQSIIAVGAGAITKQVSKGKIAREQNPKNPSIYIERQRSLSHRDGRKSYS